MPTKDFREWTVKDNVVDATFYDLRTGKPILYFDNLRVTSLQDANIEYQVDHVMEKMFGKGLTAKVSLDKTKLDKGQLSILLGYNLE
jgi:hypothetical protein